jgi:hypothetical protein
MPKSATLALPAVASAAAERDVSASVSAEKGLPLRLGMLTEQIPPALVDEAVADAGRLQRWCRLLPARAVVYFVLGCACSAAPMPPARRVTAVCCGR